MKYLFSHILNNLHFLICIMHFYFVFFAQITNALCHGRPWQNQILPACRHNVSNICISADKKSGYQMSCSTFDWLDGIVCYWLYRIKTFNNYGIKLIRYLHQFSGISIEYFVFLNTHTHTQKACILLFNFCVESVFIYFF